MLRSIKLKEMSDTEEILFDCTPPAIKEAANTATQDLLPEKSKARYEKEYTCYKDWCNRKSVTNVGSENVLLAYFSELGKNKKSSTLWSSYSMLRSTLKIKQNIDISKHNRLLAYLKKLNVGYKPKKSSVFTKQDVDKFLENAPLEYLPQKVGLIIGISGACRSDELFKMRIIDVGFLENKISIQIPDSKNYQPRSFIINNPTWCSVIKQYVDLRNNSTNERFFLQVRFGKITKQPIGHNTIAQFPKKIAAFLKLPNVDSYTGHCFRRTAATLLVNRGGDVMQLKRLGGWKSSAIAESYVASSLDNQVKTADMLSAKNPTTDIHQPGPSSISTQEFNISNEQIKHGLSLVVNSSGNSNVTINLNACSNN